MAVARSIFGDVVDDVIFAHKLIGCSTSPLTCTQLLAWCVEISVEGSGCSGLLLAVGVYYVAVGASEVSALLKLRRKALYKCDYYCIYDIMLAHNVPAYIATSK